MRTDSNTNDGRGANTNLRETGETPVTPIKKRPCDARRSEEHTSELQSHSDLVCRLLLEKKTNKFTKDGRAEPDGVMRGELRYGMHLCLADLTNMRGG